MSGLKKQPKKEPSRVTSLQLAIDSPDRDRRPVSSTKSLVYNSARCQPQSTSRTSTFSGPPTSIVGLFLRDRSSELAILVQIVLHSTFTLSSGSTMLPGGLPKELLSKEPNCVEVGAQKTKLFYANEKVVQELMAEDAKTNPTTQALLEHLKTHDVKEGIYEGGLKVWEGALDLANFLLSPDCPVQLEGSDVFEIGCGAGLLGVLASKMGCGRVVMQDYNDVVLNFFTRTNFIINDIDDRRVEYVHGDWKDVTGELGAEQFDVIVTAETIYNEDSYSKLHDLMFKTLKKNGRAYLAAKIEYFGVGGSLGAFLHYVRTQGKFQAEVKWTSSSSVPRKVIELTKV
uniref:protein-histidine N-methyltransferase n=1 Tax=Steinernema glaseri TaxID=37863 RepID=A0A1I7Z645_9BILA